MLTDQLNKESTQLVSLKESKTVVLAKKWSNKNDLILFTRYLNRMFKVHLFGRQLLVNSTCIILNPVLCFAHADFSFLLFNNVMNVPATLPEQVF